jgi:hypothetical protein
MNIFITLLENVNKSRTSANNLSLLMLLAVLVGFCIVLMVARWRTKEMNKEEL